MILMCLDETLPSNFHLQTKKIPKLC